MQMPAALARRRDVTAALVRAEIRDTRDLTPFGILKWLLEPLMYIFTYFVLVDLVFQRGQGFYPLFLLCALLPWSYLQQVTTRGMLLIRVLDHPDPQIVRGQLVPPGAVGVDVLEGTARRVPWM